MEANQITCPQCGLANNELAEACAQCGLIFVKSPAMKVRSVQDEQKRTAIEEAEAMLDKPQVSSEIDAFTNEIIKRPEAHEDTVEMEIPKEGTTDIKTDASAPQEPKAEENKNSENHEIEMEAIEAVMEAIDGTDDPEALFLSEVDPTPPAETTVPAADPAPVLSSSELQKADDQSVEILQSGSDRENSRDGEAEAPSQKPVEDGHRAEAGKQEPKQVDMAGADARSVTAEPAKPETMAGEVVESVKREDHPAFGDAPRPEKREMHPEKKPESTMAEAAPAAPEAQNTENAVIEMPVGWDDGQDPANPQLEKNKQEALKRQREAQIKAEALEKQKAAQAEALKKKKLALAQAAALKKQKAAQLKAEALKKKKEALFAGGNASAKQEAMRARADALKKQKAAQARAEATSKEIQLAGIGMAHVAAAYQSHHERLLGLLKRYKGKAIGINYDHSSEIREAELVDANEEFFSVRVKDKKLQYSYPLKTILTIVEGKEGVETGEGDQKARFDAVIKVYPLVLS